jgi:hypothetical protein
MSGRKDAAREVLKRVQYLHPSQHEDVLRELDAAGLLDNPGGNADFGAVRGARAAPRGRLSPLRTPMEAVAANVENEVAIKQIKATARRIAGFDVKDNELVDPIALDKALAGKDVETRMGLKLNMARLGLIP